MATETDYNELYKILIKKMPTPEDRLEWIKQHQVLSVGPPKKTNSTSSSGTETDERSLLDPKGPTG